MNTQINNIMKLSEKQHESLIYLFLLFVLAFVLLGCKPSKEVTGTDDNIYKVRKGQFFWRMLDRKETEDEKQMRFFKEEIVKRKLNKLY